ncbi:helix-turn-helix domain-containing protein [Kineococcus sp. NBC_00420]|uniref:helix-turn-helix domain-containing protein n=1 Tax=Kineococcus sp. NBC_00420 TaxID=2903564 RepID=UPI002E246695
MSDEARRQRTGRADPRPVRGGVRVDDRLAASWRRSEDYGVRTGDVEPVFSGTWERESLFYECGREVLTELHRTLVDEPVSLMLTDADGLVLNRLSGDTSLLRSLDAVHLAPGFAFSEREAGTSGLGLALADRLPTVVRADQHYSASLVGYTCAAVPVLDPLSGRLEGSVNITTWAEQPGKLLLALAQSAAGATSALMLARSRGRTPRPAPRGEVFHVQHGTLEPGSGTVEGLSRAWREALVQCERSVREGRVVVAVGERGAGRSTLLAQAVRRVRPRDRILSASPPAPQDLERWLALWSPELGKADTAVVVCEVDHLPARVAEELRALIAAARTLRPDLPVVLTAEDLAEVPAPLAVLVDAVVAVPPLRERPSDVLPLAAHVVRHTRGRDLEITPAAARALESCSWPGNVDQLHTVVRRAALQADTIDVRHLPAEVFSGSSHRLSRLETVEREEIVRCLTTPGMSVKQAAEELGMSRATIYRKVAQYDLHIPR